MQDMDSVCSIWGGIGLDLEIPWHGTVIAIYICNLIWYSRALLVRAWCKEMSLCESLTLGFERVGR